MLEHTVHRQIVYRLLPERRSNWRWLEQTLEDQRLLYNAALEERVDCYRKTGRTLTFYDQTKSLTLCRKTLPNMAAVTNRIQRGTLKRLDNAYKGFFRQQRGFPKFQSRHRWNSFSIMSDVRVEGDHLHIPRFGWLRIRRRGGNPHADGRPLSAALKREGGKWYAVVCYAVTVAESEDDGTAIGVDMNAGQVATSDGRIHRMPDMARLEARKRRYQRMVARRKRGSRRRERAKQRLAKTARRIATTRRDWQHQTSRRIADAAHTVAIEDLKTKGMTRDGGAHKRGLNRIILETGWGTLRRMLTYKAGRLIAVNPAYTSQTCAACGTVDAKSRRSQAEFHCVACGHADNADMNASRNIRRQGLALLHGEVAGLPGRRTVNAQEAA